MAVDFEVWAPLGADDRMRQLWRATPDAHPLPDGVEPLAPAGAPAKERLGELAVPTLVVTVAHDPAGFREIGPLVASAAPDARHVELDSDHYVTLREPELVARTLLDFLESVIDLDQQRVALAAAGADRGEPEPAAVRGAARAPSSPRIRPPRGADRMAERDGAAVDVHGLLVGAEHRRRVERDRGRTPR